MREKLVGQFDKEKGKFMDEPDTKFQPSLDQKLPETKRFRFADKVSDFGLNDMISDKKFRFGNVDNHMLLGEQLPEDRAFKFSAGIKGINDHFDSMAPNKDYRYTDPQFYEYKLKGMTQQKVAETNWRVQGDSITNPDDLDGYARAVAYAEQYRKSRQARTSAPVERIESAPETVFSNVSKSAKTSGSSSEKVFRSVSGSDSAPETVFRGVSRNPNTNLINALVPYGSKPTSAKNSPNNSKPPSRRNSDSALDLTGSKVVDQMEQLEKGGINIEPAKMKNTVRAKENFQKIAQNVKNRKEKTNKNIEILQTGVKKIRGFDKLKALNPMKSSFARWKTHTNEEREKNMMSAEEKKSPGKIHAPKETASTPKKGEKKQEAKQPEPPSKKESNKLNLFASATAQTFTPSQRNQAINGALTGLKNEFDTKADSLIGVEGAKRFLEYGLTVNGNSKWSTAKSLLVSQLSKEGQKSKVDELVDKGGRRTEMDKIFQPVLGAKGGGKTKISSNVLFDDKVNGMGFEAFTPDQSRAPSKASDAKKKVN